MTEKGLLRHIQEDLLHEQQVCACVCVCVCVCMCAWCVSVHRPYNVTDVFLRIHARMGPSVAQIAVCVYV